MKKAELKKIKEMCETRSIKYYCEGCIFLKPGFCGARNLNKKDHPKRPDKWIIE